MATSIVILHDHVRCRKCTVALQGERHVVRQRARFAPSLAMMVWRNFCRRQRKKECGGENEEEKKKEREGGKDDRNEGEGERRKRVNGWTEEDEGARRKERRKRKGRKWKIFVPHKRASDCMSTKEFSPARITRRRGRDIFLSARMSYDNRHVFHNLLINVARGWNSLRIPAAHDVEDTFHPRMMTKATNTQKTVTRSWRRTSFSSCFLFPSKVSLLSSCLGRTRLLLCPLSSVSLTSHKWCQFFRFMSRTPLRQTPPLLQEMANRFPPDHDVVIHPHQSCRGDARRDRYVRYQTHPQSWAKAIESLHSVLLTFLFDWKVRHYLQSMMISTRSSCQYSRSVPRAAPVISYLAIEFQPTRDLHKRHPRIYSRTADRPCQVQLRSRLLVVSFLDRLLDCCPSLGSKDLKSDIHIFLRGNRFFRFLNRVPA